MSADRDDVIDRAREVRDGEQLDLPALEAYLRRELPIGDEPLSIEQFPGGHSNLTYALRAGGREWVLRRPPIGSKVATAHDMGREFRMLERLAPVYPKAPTPVLHCDDASVLGAPFYLMERLHGVIIRRRPPPGLGLDEATAAALCRALVDTLAELHAIDYQAIGLGDFGKPEGYVARQVSGWTKRYRGAQTDQVAVVDEVAAWLAANQPAESGASIIHNDYKFDNLVLDPSQITRIIGILDWEMTTIGDPLMDLGTALSYWVQASDADVIKMIGFGPTMLPGMLTRREVAERYAEVTGRDTADILFYYCYGLFKTAVVVQQIYYRYRQGLTKDERFAQFGFAMKILVDTAAAAIAAQRI
jgi:aminoglycoside phosphotransferase (APT) family kinase protein